MKRFMLLTALALAPFFGCSAVQSDAGMGDNAVIQSIQATPKHLEVNFRVEPLSDEQIRFGITQEELNEIVAKRLDEANIGLNESIMQPLLVLRVRTIQSGLDYATFFQLSLHEESMLVRNRSTFNAVTWSQASLLSCRPEELNKEVKETVDAMAQSFVKDFVKALQGSSL